MIRQWCLEIPEIVNISVNTPYPGTESWLTESRRVTSRDYRLFDIQHAVLPTTLPLEEFYGELVRTQQVLNRKHLGWAAMKALAGILARNLARGQTNTLEMLWKFNSVYNPELQLADHRRPVRYEMAPPPAPQGRDRPPVDLHSPRAGPSRSRHRRRHRDVRRPDADEGRRRDLNGPLLWACPGNHSHPPVTNSPRCPIFRMEAVRGRKVRPIEDRSREERPCLSSAGSSASESWCRRST